MDIELILIAVGLLVLLTAWLPLFTKRLPLSLPIFCVAIGAGSTLIPTVAQAVPHPESHLGFVEHATGLVVLLSLIGAGLKIDTPFGLRRWALAWRMLGIAMPLTIAVLTVLAMGLLRLPFTEALLLGAALAPTDPVLAADVQVGGPASGDGDEVRFTLTTEASLNDGAAFPFVALAIAAATAGGGPGGVDLLRWFGLDVAWKIAAGALLGAAIGRALGWVTFHMPASAKILAKTGDGFVALGVTLLAYGLVELAHGYGFIGVFAAAVALRAACPDSDYHERLHEFSEEIERLLMMAVLVVFGAALARGGLLSGLRWPVVAFAVAALLVVRPLCGMVGLVGSGRGLFERAVIAFFGVRGLATGFYLAYAFQHAAFGHRDVIWASAAFVVLLSIVLHGCLATPSLSRLDRRRAAAEG